jgi:hypothetical protein
MFVGARDWKHRRSRDQQEAEREWTVVKKEGSKAPLITSLSPLLALIPSPWATLCSAEMKAMVFFSGRAKLIISMLHCHFVKFSKRIWFSFWANLNCHGHTWVGSWIQQLLRPAPPRSQLWKQLVDFSVVTYG